MSNVQDAAPILVRNDSSGIFSPSNYMLFGSLNNRSRLASHSSSFEVYNHEDELLNSVWNALDANNLEDSKCSAVTTGINEKAVSLDTEAKFSMLNPHAKVFKPA